MKLPQLDPAEIQRVLEAAFAEDVGSGDITTAAIIPGTAAARARAVVRETGVIAGLPVFSNAFRFTGHAVQVVESIDDGAAVLPGDVIAELHGSAAAILTPERVALNFLQRMSGIATATSRYVAAVAGTQARILDTRKTVPGLRLLDKYAVAAGGGHNHRLGLHDAILIKDNHIRAAGSLASAVTLVRGSVPADLPRFQVECDTLAQVDECLGLGVEWLLLDNMSLTDLRAAVARAAGRANLEASGGVNLDNVAAIAATGVDYISIGALTHSVIALDISLDFL
ncbi:MAG TPA: carboxylating nicotinate-nucleotide diphosphorylase [Chloroflexota bacterium]|nr:carboxylating nicotinate-nucleotide diphosphorylase [Chloroflexota bacterium]